MAVHRSRLDRVWRNQGSNAVRGRCKIQVAADRTARLADAVVGLQIHLLIFDAAPQPLDEDIVPPSPFAVHADRNVVADEHSGEDLTRELRTLVGVEDIRLP